MPPSRLLGLSSVLAGRRPAGVEHQQRRNRIEDCPNYQALRRGFDQSGTGRTAENAELGHEGAEKDLKRRLGLAC